MRPARTHMYEILCSPGCTLTLLIVVISDVVKCVFMIINYEQVNDKLYIYRVVSKQS